MAKTIFEEMGGTYVRQGDYYLPLPHCPKKNRSQWACGDKDTFEVY